MKYPTKILSTTDFVIWLEKNYNDENYPEPFSLYVINYARLMKTPLSIEMFIAAKGRKVLFEGWEIGNPESDGYYLTCQKSANKAFWNLKDSEFELRMGGGFNTIETIEQLIIIETINPTDRFWNQIFKQ